MHVVIDAGLCQGHANCQETVPEVFRVSDHGGVTEVLLENPPESLRAKIEEAVHFCPAEAIRIED